jgi:hypothetical protein
VVRDGVDLRVRPVRRRGKSLQRLEDRLDPFVLVAMDSALDVERDLQRMA